ncbi:MAG: hypothetical protein H8E79_07645 [Desulfobulbaceae bacterium]|uniref:Uncharacterized protein n=1 Tax=Candidatus Desulfatifera sulfidica TaxID=2841691 RepID=A0A8J6N8V1_9BACT|nr:hypothetical protein [Candidatus Desulfatifera sulfidica]
MAAAKKKKKTKKIKFELTLPAIVGIAVVCFCIFLWMYLLGVWTGQSFLQKSYTGFSGEKSQQTEELASKTALKIIEISPVKKKEVIR